MHFGPLRGAGRDYQFYGESMERGGDFYSTNSRTARLEDNPHYTDDYWREARTIFGRRIPGLGYEYDDRIRQWDYAKAESSWKAAEQDGHALRTAAFYEAYLTHYHGRPLELVHIMAGVNWSNGYPYLVFGFRDKK